MKPRCVAALTIPGRYQIHCKMNAHHTGAHFGTSPFDSRDVRWHGMDTTTDNVEEAMDTSDTDCGPSDTEKRVASRQRDIEQVAVLFPHLTPVERIEWWSRLGCSLTELTIHMGPNDE